MVVLAAPSPGRHDYRAAKRATIAPPDLSREKTRERKLERKRANARGQALADSRIHRDAA